MERLEAEQEFHDRQARRRRETFEREPARLRFADDLYLDHESWIRPALAELGDVAGQPLLDLGCGHGMAAVVLARRGARVTACDLSFGYLDEAHRRARANGVGVRFLAADAHRLPFADASFTRIWGHAILHHLDLDRAAGELARVLAPDGVAVVCEPWGENPLLNWTRQHLPYPGKHRTVDEKPLCRGALDFLRRHFRQVDVHGHQLLAMARRVLPRRRRLLAGLDWCDSLLLRRVPSLRRFCRYAVLTLRR